ncbi:uncharacterized protein LOC107832808 isoform X4 [Nicotiana tabacum]|uniref:Uncharacterized protein LOC107832808 isoform X4 n=1 Tax=Nicotiana tabacum TaxID=4097 RepID=A0AC58S2M2_TOBAC
MCASKGLNQNLRVLWTITISYQYHFCVGEIMCPFHLLLNHVFFIPAAREILVFPHSLCILSTNAPSSISVLFIFFVHFHLLNRCCNFRVIILLWKLRVKNFSKIVAETILDFHSEHSIQPPCTHCH